MKSLISSKTVWFAIIQGIIGVWTAVVAVNPDVAKTGYAVVIAAVIQVALRVVTTTPIGGVFSTEPSMAPLEK